MKTIGIILIVFSGVWLAFKIYRSYQGRINVLRELLSDLEVIKNEVVFKKATLCEALKKVKSEGICREFYEKILSSLKEGEGVREGFIKAMESFSYCFSKEDERAVSDFGRLLGSTDVEGQIRAFEIFGGELKKNLSEAEKNKNEKMKSECAAVIFGFAAVALIVI